MLISHVRKMFTMVRLVCVTFNRFRMVCSTQEKKLTGSVEDFIISFKGVQANFKVMTQEF